WIKLYATASYDVMFDLEIMPDGGYVMACHGGPILNQFNALVMRTDSLGTVNWVQQFDTPNSTDVAFGVSVCANGDVLMTGMSQDLQFYQTDLIAARFDDLGNVLWCRSYTSLGLPHSGINIDELYDGSIAIGVDASLFTPQFQSTYYQAIGLMRLNSDGDLLSMQILSDSASGGIIQQSGKANDGGIWILGNRFLITPANGIIASYPTLIKTDTSLQSGCYQFESVLDERPYNFSLLSSINQSTRTVSWYEPVYDTLPLSLVSDTVLCLEKFSAQEPVIVSVEPLTIPNVFTPNADGINDLFLPSGTDIGNYRLLIYNRWGNLITDLENTGWNGRNIQGVDVVDGTYYYVFEFGAQRYTGFFSLAR
ncbi:MAG: gliding motility-associated C-terminal domain-containing protein, partial [Bacteroidia bacterium]